MTDTEQRPEGGAAGDENPYRADATGDALDSVNEQLIYRGQIVVLGLIGGLLLLSVLDISLFVIYFNAGDLPRGLTPGQVTIRFVLTVGLCTLLYHGHTLARVLLTLWHGARLLLIAWTLARIGLPRFASPMLTLFYGYMLLVDVGVVVALTCFPSVSHFLRASHARTIERARAAELPPDTLEECPWCDEFVVRTEDDSCPQCGRPI